jgi:hypothetical protein
MVSVDAAQVLIHMDRAGLEYSLGPHALPCESIELDKMAWTRPHLDRVLPTRTSSSRLGGTYSTALCMSIVEFSKVAGAATETPSAQGIYEWKITVFFQHILRVSHESTDWWSKTPLDCFKQPRHGDIPLQLFCETSLRSDQDYEAAVHLSWA